MRLMIFTLKVAYSMKSLVVHDVLAVKSVHDVVAVVKLWLEISRGLGLEGQAAHS
jgi:hypothetical protein